MSDTDEFRCFIGGLAWSTSDRRLKDAFEKYGKLVEAKVVVDKFSGRSRGFGFVTFDDKEAMEEAIEAMNGIDLDGRTITVDKAQPQGSRDDDDRHRERGRDSRDRNRSRDYGGSRGSNGGECFKCGKPGHFARECPSEGERGGRYGGRESRYSGGYGPDRNADRSYGGRDRESGGRDRDGGGRDRDGGGRDRDGGGRDRDGGGRDRDGGGRDRDGGGRDRDRDRAGPYERRGSGGHR